MIIILYTYFTTIIFVSEQQRVCLQWKLKPTIISRRRENTPVLKNRCFRHANFLRGLHSIKRRYLYMSFHGLIRVYRFQVRVDFFSVYINLHAHGWTTRPSKNRDSFTRKFDDCPQVENQVFHESENIGNSSLKLYLPLHVRCHSSMLNHALRRC